ncbi:MAG: peptide chain release factor N(5)-glutamine methyltransferase [Candidatus Peregrinibacteria bacterium]|nr:peptide chain release factor N(5)-glutamine methyltransferase [Candidatus Peregrinibacteria bacterium]
MTLTVSDILKYSKGLDLLKEVETLLCDYLEIDNVELFLTRDKEIPKNIETLIQMNIDTLKEGYPLAYIRGKVNFYGLEFIVNKNVLIPRRDTEIIVNEAIGCIKKLNKLVRMLELGVGSGCISISIANEFSLPDQLSILGIEKSEEALQVANENVKKHKLENIIELSEGDLLDGIDDEFDILVANLPYVDLNAQLGSGVREHEPHMALFADDGGLALYRQVLEQIADKGMKFKYILFEIGFDQGEGAIELCKSLACEYEVSVVKDLEGRDRVVFLSSCKIS